MDWECFALCRHETKEFAVLSYFCASCTSEKDRICELNSKCPISISYWQQPHYQLRCRSDPKKHARNCYYRKLSAGDYVIPGDLGRIHSDVLILMGLCLEEFNNLYVVRQIYRCVSSLLLHFHCQHLHLCNPLHSK